MWTILLIRAFFVAINLKFYILVCCCTREAKTYENETNTVQNSVCIFEVYSIILHGKIHVNKKRKIKNYDKVDYEDR